MDWKIEVVTIPVSDIERARDFYSREGRVRGGHRLQSQRRRPPRPVDSAWIRVFDPSGNEHHRYGAWLHRWRVSGRRGRARRTGPS